MKKIVAYKVELAFAISTLDQLGEVSPWEKIGLRGWTPWGDPVVTSVPGKAEGENRCLVFQAFVKYDED